MGGKKLSPGERERSLDLGVTLSRFVQHLPLELQPILARDLQYFGLQILEKQRKSSDRHKRVSQS